MCKLTPRVSQLEQSTLDSIKESERVQCISVAAILASGLDKAADDSIVRRCTDRYMEIILASSLVGREAVGRLVIAQRMSYGDQWSKPAQ
ncbi:hypothetical protein RRG08_029637 [Elysia crispata]|uniref:Uncharacterized protein n=1 Tax=Elysia crispata TaxID=231223 RepID=A0AAE1CJN0_9GAST|nr:hypothetical protein RRG08_029637 [Elysia crispata]